MKNKKQIDEEEKYRAQLQAKIDKTTTSTKKNEMNGCLVIIIVLAILLVISLMAINPSKQIDEAKESNNELSNIESKNGSYQSLDGNIYKYEITFEKEKKQYVASFTPFLPRNDANLLEASFRLIEVTYGNNSRIIPTPIIELRQGKNVIKFNAGNGSSYYVFPIKESTGEVHTLMYWKE